MGNNPYDSSFEKRKTMRFSIIQILPFFVISCVSEVDISLNEPEKEITINCILTPDVDTVTAWLSYSKPVLSSTGFEPINNALPILYEQGNPVGQFRQTDSTAWVLPYKIKPGAKYKIEVTTNNTTIWAETIVPQLISAEIDSLQLRHYGLDYKISFFDNPNEENFYWITAKGFSWYNGLPYYEMAGYFYSDFTFADDFNRLTYPGYGYIYEYNSYMRIKGGSLPNSFIQIQFYPPGISLSDGPQKVFILSVDYHLDKYMKSSLLMEENDLWAEDVPIVYAPFPVYSNIHGGTGIFGSFISVSKEFSRD
jgi:hypothetical protein